MSFAIFRRFISYKSGQTIFSLASHIKDRGSPVAIVRVSGPSTSQALFSLTGKKPSPRVATLCSICDPSNKEVIDKGLVLWFPRPNSYTGEDVCEFMLHGSKAVISRLIRILGQQPGLRPAEPGEFTKRALLNGKVDLIEAEAIKDLIESQTDIQRKRALEGISGETSKLYQEWQHDLVKSLADIEAEIDFGEEEQVDDDCIERTKRRLENLRKKIQKFTEGCQRKTDIAKDGFRVAIMGEPNVGKSSLMNLLAQREVSIVSKTEGTTRDIVEVVLDMNGHLVILQDTAGLREVSSKSDHDIIEEEGIRRARQAATTAHLVIFLVDASKPSSVKELVELEKECSGVKVITVVNKIDLLGSVTMNNLSSEYDCFISCIRKEGIDSLEEKVLKHVESTYSISDHGFMTERQGALLSQALHSIDSALSTLETDVVVAAHHVRKAATSVSSLTKRNISSEDILDVIFRDFCIGK